MTRRERTRVGNDWLRAARLEHASIGSFARFTLELLRYGAPPDLDDDLGPGALDLGEAASLSESLGDFAEAVAREGCMGETLAAIDAAARRSQTTDPVVRSVLDTIEADESRHAALAWRTLRWLLETEHSAAMRGRLSLVFSTPPVEASCEEASVAERGAGVLGSAERQNVMTEGWRRVIEPAWRALIEDTGPHAVAVYPRFGASHRVASSSGMPFRAA